jgi:hypothetical protein
MGEERSEDAGFLWVIVIDDSGNVSLEIAQCLHCRLLFTHLTEPR